MATGPRSVTYYPLDGGGFIPAKGLFVAGFVRAIPGHEQQTFHIA